MLILETLGTRLRQWSKQLATHIPTPPSSSPILLYQETFALVHDLKSSVFVSADEGIRALLPSVQSAETNLRKLASDELELMPRDNEGLYKVATGLQSIEMLEVFLSEATSRAASPPRPTPPLLQLPFPWETLSRARATSAARHGYQFLMKESVAQLSTLSAQDEALMQELRAAGAIPIVRSLTPTPLPSGELQLATVQIAAFREADKAGSPWRKL